MIQKLCDIAEIQFGSYDKPQEKGSVKYLHASHFDNLYKPTKFEESFVELDGKNDKFLLKPNDVILAGKGHRTFAWAYDTNMGLAIPSSLFYIIKIDPKLVLGEYLALYLNSEKIQYNLKFIGAGASVPSIPKKELEQIEVVVPPLKEQEKMIDFVGVLDKDITLTKFLLDKKEYLRKGIIDSLIKRY